MVLCLANFLKGALQDELDQLFQSIFKWDVAKRVVTRSALCQARQKISHRVFIALQDAICRFLDQHGKPATYQGLRVLAMDGSTLRLPNRDVLREHFGKIKVRNGWRAMARLSLLHDVLNRITYDAVLAPYGQAENHLAWQHLEEAPLPDRCLFLMDRGYVDFNLLRHIVDLGHQFCVRLKSNLKIVREFRKTGAREQILRWRPSKQVRQQFPKNSPMCQAIPVRLIRIPSASQEMVLMTNLLSEREFRCQDLAFLYHQRWQIEESYKVKKCRLRIEEFSGLSPRAILQDFHAKIFAECLASTLALGIQDHIDDYCLKTDDDYRISLTQILAKMKNTLVLLFLRPRLDRFLSQLMDLFSKCLVAMVPGRRCPRKNEGKNGVKIQIPSMGYKLNR